MLSLSGYLMKLFFSSQILLPISLAFLAVLPGWAIERSHRKTISEGPAPVRIVREVSDHELFEAWLGHCGGRLLSLSNLVSGGDNKIVGVTCVFVINRDCSVRNIKIIRSSNSREIDQLAVKVLTRENAIYPYECRVGAHSGLNLVPLGIANKRFLARFEKRDVIVRMIDAPAIPKK